MLAHLPPADRRRFVEHGWGRKVTPPFLALHRAVEAQARLRPDTIAVEHLGTTISYRNLDRQAERLARLLRAQGVRPGDRVGIFLERSIPMVAGMLAVLKAGAAYVPQHAGVAPLAHLEHIVAAAGIKVVLTLSHVRRSVALPSSVTYIELDAAMRSTEQGPGQTPGAASHEVHPDDCCFLLFTSGTTGAPNGVKVTHRNVCNIALTDPGNLGIGPGMRVGQILSIAFDMAEWEIYGALAHGATLVIRGRDIAATAESLDVIIATPSILASLDPARCRRTQVVAVAGEPCPEPLAATWSAFCRFHNSCGPTETTIVNTVKHYCGPHDRLTIGAPTPNNTVYVLDEHRRPLPIGEVGEMWAGGDCVTAGYVANPELTADRYVDDPFIGGGAKMFRTRDLGRWTPDGELQHHGRTDDQVKVRGFRVELDSVSAVLESLPGCSRAVTLKYDNRNLVAFVEPALIDPELAATAVRQHLPYYCVPAKVYPLDRLPRTDRGKIDKRSLLASVPEGLAAGAEMAEVTR
jgi:amino acid adenylation domain-containing protein